MLQRAAFVAVALALGVGHPAIARADGCTPPAVLINGKEIERYEPTLRCQPSGIAPAGGSHNGGGLLGNLPGLGGVLSRLPGVGGLL